ncbi:ABC transporter substrate-binding protein [Sphaerisporangium krabiense]|uniref:Peptide/nickel transport system substrate-binding protein n=1 Tax=Sphaerisporangium krabiense TaxID=763782 RepID=A0A7W9DTT6_9ACTN|nr:ABC transporter substrate-binding protein [Sphaerisporangium krabiense]MBB5629770.1 peptide/nickel transport system substrate-binding protein [Sphaerisporangium krabiense]GII63869.1 ABC transporter substrate-binding protein [Sphaerisporangium krabiense]
MAHRYARRSRWLQAGVALITAGALAACSPAAAPSETKASRVDNTKNYKNGLVGVTDGGSPVKGGTLTFAATAETPVLDPAKNIYSATTGAIEMSAVFDVLMRWDSESGEIVPQLAKELKASGDYKTWTLTLRDGVKFSDGTPLDAGAVVWSIDRYLDRKGTESALWNLNVTSTEASGDSTVVFKLKKRWPGFDNLLTSGPGLIVAKASDKGTFTPIGAGPFVFERYAPQEELVLKANEAYWDGRPNLDRVRMVFLNDAQASRESLDAGSVDMTILRQPDHVDAALADGLPGYMNLLTLTSLPIINAAEGRPGHDARVHQAMQLAIDPKLIYQRVYKGAGTPTAEIFSTYSRWHTDAKPLGYDPAKAKRLVQEAKAAGFDGKIKYLHGQDPTSRAMGLTLKAALDAVGFTVELVGARTVQDIIGKVAVERDYDVATWGITLRESDPYSRMYAALHSKGTLTHGVHTGPEMDAIIEDLQGAETKEEQLKVMARFQEQWNKDVPALCFGPIPEYVTWAKRVHGVVDTATSVVLLGKAWVA